MDNKNTILIFRTSIKGKKDVRKVAAVLNDSSKIIHWNVDLEDWEKVLRIECNCITSNEISQVFYGLGIYIKELE